MGQGQFLPLGADRRIKEGGEKTACVQRVALTRPRSIKIDLSEKLPAFRSGLAESGVWGEAPATPSGDIQAFDFRMQRTALTLDVEQPEVYGPAAREAVQYHREENARHAQVRAAVRQALLEELVSASPSTTRRHPMADAVRSSGHLFGTPLLSVLTLGMRLLSLNRGESPWVVCNKCNSFPLDMDFSLYYGRRMKAYLNAAEIAKLLQLDRATVTRDGRKKGS